MFRRPLSCILSEIFRLGSKAADDSDDVVQLSRRVADELVLASIFGFLRVSDISVDYDPRSTPQCEVRAGVSRAIWLGGDKKGCYTLLDSHPRQLPKGFAVDEEPIPELARTRKSSGLQV